MSEERRIKQVIVMRHDLKMRRGKQIAQGAHASMSFICRRLQEAGSVSLGDFIVAQQVWLTGAFAKVCCRVDSEEELMVCHVRSPTSPIALTCRISLLMSSSRSKASARN